MCTIQNIHSEQIDSIALHIQNIVKDLKKNLLIYM